MYRRVIIGALLALALLGAGIGIGAAIDGDWGPGRDAIVVHDAGTGGAEPSPRTGSRAQIRKYDTDRAPGSRVNPSRT